MGIAHYWSIFPVSGLYSDLQTGERALRVEFPSTRITSDLQYGHRRFPINSDKYRSYVWFTFTSCYHLLPSLPFPYRPSLYVPFTISYTIPGSCRIPTSPHGTIVPMLHFSYISIHSLPLIYCSVRILPYPPRTLPYLPQLVTILLDALHRFTLNLTDIYHLPTLLHLLHVTYSIVQ